MNKYEEDMFMNLDTLSVSSGWFNIKSDRNDLERFIAVIKKRIDLKYDFEFNGDFTRFRRITPPQEQIPKLNESTYTIEYREQDYELNDKERNLPDPIFKSYSKKDWDRLSGRIDK